MFKEKKSSGLLNIQNCPESPNLRDKSQENSLNKRFKQSYLIKPKLLEKPENALRSKKYSSSLVAASISAVIDSLDIYQWRFSTQYPIVRVIWNGVLNKTYPIIRDKKVIKNIVSHYQNSQDKLHIEVQAQIIEPLKNFGPLSFPSFAYALKESLIGFQRLYALFGPFMITSKNIWVNIDGKVKVWLSSNYEQNSKQQLTESYQQNEEKQMVKMLKGVFFQLAQNTAIFREFFEKIKQAFSFIQMLRTLEQYAVLKKTLVTKNIRRPQNKCNRATSPIIRIHFAGMSSPYTSPSKYQELIKQYSNKTQNHLKWSNSQKSGYSTKARTTYIAAPQDNTVKNMKDSSEFIKEIKQSKQQIKRSFQNGISSESVIKCSNDSTPSSINSLIDYSMKNCTEDCLKEDLDNLFQDQNWLQQDDLNLKSCKGLNGYGREINESFQCDRS